MLATPTRHRRFSIRDGMVLVAATAVGLSLDRVFRSPEPFRSIELADWQWWVWSGPPGHLALAWSFALLGLWLLDPRPQFRRLLRRPGFAAVAMLPAAMVVGLAMHTAYARMLEAIPARAETPRYYFYVVNYFRAGVDRMPAAVLGVWLALGLSRRWRAERTWKDRLGRLIGLYWLLFFPLALVDTLVRFVRSLH